MNQFSPQEQASLVWQFMCSVPVLLLEDFLPWMTSFLSPEEQVNVVNCIKEVVPEEKLLEEVNPKSSSYPIIESLSCL